jgi:hypothetical protein
MMSHSTGTPTAAEKHWMDFLQDFGCCVCRRQGRGFVPTEIHHIVSGNRRLGHLKTLSLCYHHHRAAPAGSGEISRHPYKARFEAAYGTEDELLEYLQRRYVQIRGKLAA